MASHPQFSITETLMGNKLLSIYTIVFPITKLNVSPSIFIGKQKNSDMHDNRDNNAARRIWHIPHTLRDVIELTTSHKHSPTYAVFREASKPQSS